MAPASAVLLPVVLGLLLAERGVEVLLHRRNLGRMRARGAVAAGPDGFPLILATQVLLFALVPVEATLAPWGGPHGGTLALVLALALAQVVRYWCIASLGDRWAMRVVTVPGEAPLARGPYRWFRHPNYAVALAEAALLPAAFGAWIALAVLVPLKGVALWRRIRVEDPALRKAASRSA